MPGRIKVLLGLAELLGRRVNINALVFIEHVSVALEVAHLQLPNKHFRRLTVSSQLDEHVVRVQIAMSIWVTQMVKLVDYFGYLNKKVDLLAQVQPTLDAVRIDVLRKVDQFMK